MKTIIKRCFYFALGGENYAYLSTLISGLMAQLRRWVRLRPRFSKYHNITFKLISFSGNDKDIFFGYHDITPFSQDNSKILAMQTNNSPGSIASVGWFDIYDSEKKFSSIGQTQTWCWQQGCRLQWFPPESNSQIIYNKIIDGKYGSELFDISQNKIIRKLNSPIYALNSLGESALSLNFSRLQRLRPGYGYSVLADKTIDQKTPSTDGLWVIDLISGESELLISLSELALYKTNESMTAAEHYLNHLSYSPNGKRIIFFHLWRKGGTRYNRILSVDVDGENLNLISEHTASHVCWYSDDKIIGFTIDEDGNGRFRIFEIGESGYTNIGSDDLNLDGHPMYSPQENKIVVDSYPDKISERELSIIDLGQSLKINIAKFYSPPMLMGEKRCDLHPRWNRNGTAIAVDSAHEGKRGLFILDLNH